MRIQRQTADPIYASRGRRNPAGSDLSPLKARLPRRRRELPRTAEYHDRSQRRHLHRQHPRQRLAGRLKHRQHRQTEALRRPCPTESKKSRRHQTASKSASSSPSTGLRRRIRKTTHSAATRGQWKGGYATPDSGRFQPEVETATLSKDGTSVRLRTSALKTGFVYEINCRVKDNDKPLWPATGHYIYPAPDPE